MFSLTRVLVSRLVPVRKGVFRDLTEGHRKSYLYQVRSIKSNILGLTRRHGQKCLHD